MTYNVETEGWAMLMDLIGRIWRGGKLWTNSWTWNGHSETLEEQDFSISLEDILALHMPCGESDDPDFISPNVIFVPFTLLCFPPNSHFIEKDEGLKKDQEVEFSQSWYWTPTLPIPQFAPNLLTAHMKRWGIFSWACIFIIQHCLSLHIHVTQWSLKIL